MSREGGAFKSGISALVKGSPESSLAPPATAVCGPGSELSPDPESSGSWMLGFSASGTVGSESF